MGSAGLSAWIYSGVSGWVKQPSAPPPPPALGLVLKTQHHFGGGGGSGPLPPRPTHPLKGAPALHPQLATQ